MVLNRVYIKLENAHICTYIKVFFILNEVLNDFCCIHTIHHVVSEIIRPYEILSSMSNFMYRYYY